MCKETIKEFILQLTEADVTSANAQKPKRFSEKQTVVREEEPEKHFLTAAVCTQEIYSLNAHSVLQAFAPQVFWLTDS